MIPRFGILDATATVKSAANDVVAEVDAIIDSG
jgi:hypothetical protein